MTGSAVRPILKHVLDTCKADHKDEPLVAEMKSAIVGDLANHYDSPVISTLLDKCCFLDPRFKTNYIIGDKKLITAELELEVTKSSTCTSLADDNSPMALEPEAENEVSPSPVKKAKRLGVILSKLPTAEVSTEVSMAEKFKREVGSYLD